VAPYSGNSKSYARAGLAMIGLAWSLPFLQPYHRFPLPGFYSEWLAFALGLAGALVLLRKAPSAQIELPAVAIAPLAFAFVLGVQAALGLVIYTEQAWTAALYLLWATLLIVLGRRLRRELGMEEIAATLAWCVLAGGILSAAAGLLQHFQAFAVPAWLVSPKVLPVVYGNLGQSNHFAAYLVIALASALYLYGSGRLAGGWMTACAAAILPPLALSGSRSIWLYVALLAVLAAALWRVNRGLAGRRLGIATICLLPGLGVAHWLVTLSFAAPPPSEPPAVTSVDRIFHVATGAGLRMQLWEGAWRMFLDAPALGVGFGQFAWHHFLQAAGDSSMDPRVYRHAHNLVAHLLAETGLTGALVVAGPLGAWLAELRRIRLDLEWTWLLGLLSLIGMHSLLEFPLWYAYFLGIAALLLGIGSRAGVAVRGSAAARTLLAVVIAWGCFNLAAVLAPYRQFERLFFLPGSAAAAPDERAFGASIRDLYREPALVPYIELAIAFGIRVNPEHLAEKVRLSGRAARFAPVPVVSARYAMLLAMAGEREQALTQLGRTLGAYPAEAPRLVVELERLAQRHPLEFQALLELARSVARAARRSPP
jgi:O-antigen ligase